MMETCEVMSVNTSGVNGSGPLNEEDGPHFANGDSNPTSPTGSESEPSQLNIQTPVGEQNGPSFAYGDSTPPSPTRSQTELSQPSSPSGEGQSTLAYADLNDNPIG
jgi:hypothetical protein